MSVARSDKRPWIADAHFHLWDLQRYRYPWLESDGSGDSALGDYSALRRNFLIEDYLEAAQGQDVRMAVHLEANPADAVAETAWLQQVSDTSGFRFAIIGFARLQEPLVSQTLEGHMRFSGLRGIRQALNFGEAASIGEALMDDPAWRRGFSRLGPAGLSFDMQVFPSQMATASQLAHDFPDTLIILDHAGMPVDMSPQGKKSWQRGIRSLARHDNVVAKISGFAQTDPHWSVAGIRPFVLGTIDVFGPNRCMFASNFPVDVAHATFDDLFDAYRGITADFNASELDALFHETAVRTYRLNEFSQSNSGGDHESVSATG